MTMLAPWVLAGMAAVGLPVLIHLLNRGQAKPMRWAAMRFLLESVKKNRRRLQMRDLILLALRVLLVALAVLLFTRPARVVRDSEGGAFALPMTAMLVVDVSASMAQSDGQRTRMDEARSQALDFLGRLDGRSRAGLLLAGDGVRAVVPRPSANLPVVQRAVEQASATHSASDLLPAIKRAYDELEKAPGEHKEIVVFTDSQKLAFRNQGEILRLAAAHPEIALRIPEIGKGAEDNLAVRRVAPASARAVTGEPVPVKVEVANFGAEPVSNVRVTLSTNRKPPEDEATIAMIAPGKAETVTLTARLDEAGAHTVTAAIPADRFPVDNQRSATLQADARMVVTIAGESAGMDPRKSPGFFIENGLGALGDGGTEIRRVGFSELGGDVLEQSAVIILADPPDLPVPAWQALRGYVERGGALVIFPGPATPPSLGGAPATAWIPARLSEAKLPTGGLAWRQGSLTHPVTAPWRDTKRIDLAALRANRLFLLTVAPDARDVTPLASYADGRPVALEGRVGRGRVVVSSILPTPEWTNLVLHPFFPILMRDLVGYLGGAGGGIAAIRPGESFTLDASPALAQKPVFLETPGSDERVEAGQIEIADQRGTARLGPFDQPGGYRVFVGDDKEALASFSVAMDEGESDLAVAPRDQVEVLAREATVAPSSDGVVSAAPAALAMKELWLFFAILVALVFCAEFIVARAFTPAR